MTGSFSPHLSLLQQRRENTGRKLLVMSWRACNVVAQAKMCGSVGRGELARRADQFAAGRWTKLINQAR